MPRQIHSINSSRTRTRTHTRMNKMISLSEIRTHIQSPTCDYDQLTTEFLCFVCVCEAKRAAESEQHRWTITTNERSKECEMCLCMSACVRLSPNQSRYAPIGLRTSSAVFLRKPKCKHTLTAQFLSRGLHVVAQKTTYLSFIDLFGIAKISHSVFCMSMSICFRVCGKRNNVHFHLRECFFSCMQSFGEVTVEVDTQQSDSGWVYVLRRP